MNFIKPIFKIMDQMSSDFKRICALYGMKPKMNIKHQHKLITVPQGQQELGINGGW